MNNTKFYKILITLSKDEFLDLEFFIKYITKARPKCLQLFEIIKKAYKGSRYDWAKVNLEKPKVYFELYKTRMKNTNNIRELSSEFYKHLKKYCAFLQFNEDEEMYFLRYLNKNEVNDLFEKEFKRIKDENNKILGLDRLLKNVELTEFYETYKIKKIIREPTNLNQLMKDFNNFSNLKQLQLYNAALQNTFARNFEIDPELERSSTEILNQFEINNNVKLLFQLYIDSINMLKFKEEPKYELLKTKIYKKFALISSYDLYGIMSSLISFCNQQIQKKSPTDALYYREELQLHYFYMYNNDLLSDGNYTPAQHIKNICSLAVLRIRETGRLQFSIQEAKEVIENSKQKTIPRFRESTYHFNIGTFYFFQNEYDNAVKAFESKTSYANPYFTFDAKLYLLKCYYLTDDDEKHEKLIIAFRVSLGRDKFFSLQEKTSYSNSTKAIVNLQKIKINIKFTYKHDSDTDIKKLKLFLKENSVQSSSWFLEQLEKLSS